MALKCTRGVRGGMILLEAAMSVRQIRVARAHGLWTYKPRQGRKAATVVCSAFAVVTLAFFEFRMQNLECGMTVCFFTLHFEF